MEVRLNAQAQNVNAAGTDKTTKTEAPLGPHTIKLADNPPIRLDKIGHTRIKPLGIRTSTRLANTAAGMNRQSTIMLDALKRDNGTLDVASLLKAFNTFDRYAYYQLKTKKVENPAMVYVGGMARGVANLTNAEITSIYTTLLSREMDDLKMALEHEARANPKLRNAMVADLSILGDLESLIICESSRRSLMATQSPQDLANLTTLEEQYGYGKQEEQVTHRGDQDMRAPALTDVMNHAFTSAQGMKAATKTYAEAAQANHLEPLDVRKLGDVLRNSELTINISPDILFGDGSDPDNFPVNDEDFGVKNIFQLKEENINVTTKSYQLMREAAEDALFPTLRGHLTGKERPVYGALNTLKALSGTCSAYGRAVLILKPEVKQTATYTYGDTLKIPYVKLDAAKKTDFVNSLLKFQDILTPETQQALQEPGSQVSQALDAMLATGRECTIETLSETPQFRNFQDLLHFQPDYDTSICDKGYFIQQGLVRTFQDKDKNFHQVASYNHLESLLPAMGEGNILQLDVLNRKNTTQVQIQGADYIEAQLAKPMNLRRDVAEIRLFSSDFGSEERANIAAWSQQTGIKVTFCTNKQVNKNIEDLTNIIKRVPNQVKQLKMNDDLIRSQNVLMNFNTEQRAQAMVDAHPQHERLQELIGKQNVLRGALADNMPGRLMKAMQTATTNSLFGGLTSEKLRQAAEEKFDEILKAKIHLLLKLDTLAFDNNDQKLAFAKWVMESNALNTESEMLLLYNGMTNSAKGIADFLAGPNAQSPLEFNKLVSRLNLENIDKFIRYMDGSGRGDYGGDDIFAEFNRFAFLTIGQLKNQPGGDEKIKSLATLIGSQEYKTFQMTCAAVTEKVAQIRDTQVIKSMVPARMMGSYLASLGNAVSKDLKLPDFSEMTLMDLVSIPNEIRKNTVALMPGVNEVVEKYWPADHPARVFKTFSRPEPNSIPHKSLQDRRDFLRQQLEAYHQHDLTFDAHTDTHGRTHAVRAFIFANVLCNILKQRGIEVDINAVSFAIAAHDMGRQGPGADLWEADSARLCQQAVQKATENPGDSYLKDIADCIQSNQDNAPTLEALMLHCADSMDFTRIATIDMTKFPFLREAIVQGNQVVQPDDRLRHTLITEASLLARLTHPATGARSVIELLTREFSDNPSDMETMQKLQKLQQTIAQETEKRAQNESNDQVLERVEGILRDNPTLFPLLNEFYRD